MKTIEQVLEWIELETSKQTVNDFDWGYLMALKMLKDFITKEKMDENN